MYSPFFWKKPDCAKSQLHTVDRMVRDRKSGPLETVRHTKQNVCFYFYFWFSALREHIFLYLSSALFLCFVPLPTHVFFSVSTFFIQSERPPFLPVCVCIRVLGCAVCVCLSSHTAAREVIQFQTVVSQFAVMGI